MLRPTDPKLKSRTCLSFLMKLGCDLSESLFKKERLNEARERFAFWHKKGGSCHTLGKYDFFSNFCERIARFWERQERFALLLKATGAIRSQSLFYPERPMPDTALPLPSWAKTSTRLWIFAVCPPGDQESSGDDRGSHWRGPDGTEEDKRTRKNT